MTKERTMLVDKFLWLPKRIDGKWVWLRDVTVVMKYITRHSLPPEGVGEIHYEEWVVVRYNV